MKTLKAKKDLVNFLTRVSNEEVSSQAQADSISKKNAKELADLIENLVKAIITDTEFIIPPGSVIIQVVGSASGVPNVSPLKIQKIIK